MLGPLHTRAKSQDLLMSRTLNSPSKGRTMGVGKAVLGSHGPSSILGSENGPWCGTIAYFVAGKEGRIWFDMICLKLYQLERTTRWCLSLLDYVLEYAMKYVLLKNILKKYGLPKSASGPPLGGRPDKNSTKPWNVIHGPMCRTPCILFIHEVFFGPLGFHLHVWSELGRSPPFQPMRALRLQWSWAFSLVCDMTLI